MAEQFLHGTMWSDAQLPAAVAAATSCVASCGN